MWREYDETLFDQERFDSHEKAYVFERKRSTVPAEMFFSNQTVVDTFVGAEFFKHVPGILTGIGIIGTFFGILHGLDAFNVSADASQVRDSLKALLGSVSEAFAVSAGAIACAMVITLLEKWLLASHYKKSEELVVEIDKLYKAGAGEEMLQDLVQSSADSVANGRVLKDALVSDLKGKRSRTGVTYIWAFMSQPLNTAGLKPLSSKARQTLTSQNGSSGGQFRVSDRLCSCLSFFEGSMKSMAYSGLARQT